MERQDVVEELRLQNPWWDTGKVDIAESIIQRDLFDDLKNKLEEKRIISIIGLRRVGKTTLLKLMIEHLLKDMDPERICYFSFDLAVEEDPRRLINIFSEEIIKEPYLRYEDKVYFFFDEIQKVEDWGEQLKSIQDKDVSVKFVITGSSSMNITKGAGESLVGRTEINRLAPFSFKEYLRYEGVEITEVDFDEIYHPEDASLYKIKFKEYMEKGGLPELYCDGSIELLKQIVDLVFFRDIVEMFPVKRTEVLKGIFREIVENSGQKVNYSNMANDLNTQYRTIKSYLEYLQDSFLVEKSIPDEESHLKALRKNPKLYMSDHAFSSLWKTKDGLKAETIAFNHLKRLEIPRFHRAPEVDIVLPKVKKAFEVKYTSNVSKDQAKDLLELSEDFDLYLVTNDVYEKWDIDGRKVYVVPLWLLCLMV